MVCLEQILRTTESYLKSRSAILRKLNDSGLEPTELEAIVNLPYSSLFRRRQNKAHWRASELKLLAEALGMASGSIHGLKTLAPQLQDLPVLIREPFLREARINVRRLDIRHKNWDCWQYDELEYLACVLRKWQEK